MTCKAICSPPSLFVGPQRWSYSIFGHTLSNRTNLTLESEWSCTNIAVHRHRDRGNASPVAHGARDAVAATTPRAAPALFQGMFSLESDVDRILKISNRAGAEASHVLRSPGTRFGCKLRVTQRTGKNPDRCSPFIIKQSISFTRAHTRSHADFPAWRAARSHRVSTSTTLWCNTNCFGRHKQSDAQVD